MTLIQNIIDRSRTDLNDKVEGGSSKYSDQDIITAMNEFMNRVQAFGKNKSTGQDIAITPGTFEYSFPTNFWWPVSARLKTSNGYDTISILRDVNTHEYDFISNITSGDPQFVTILDNKIAVYPMPSSACTLRMECVNRPTLISDNATDKAKDFSLFFDASYEIYVKDYVLLRLLPADNPQRIQIKKDFEYAGGYWNQIERIEAFKYDPFNAKTRRTQGAVVSPPISDYGLHSSLV